jgi:hypothetical protein
MTDQYTYSTWLFDQQMVQTWPHTNRPDCNPRSALVESVRGLTPRVSSTVRAAAQPRLLASAAAFEGFGVTAV